MIRRPPRSTRTDTLFPYTTLFRSFICAALGIVPTVRHADYVGSWLEVLREDNRAIFRAASRASKAADFVLAFGDAEESDTTDTERRSEEHTSELQSLMRISYAVFCLKKTNNEPCLQDNTTTCIHDILGTIFPRINDIITPKLQ